jgi:hypothetical protein
VVRSEGGGSTAVNNNDPSGSSGASGKKSSPWLLDQNSGLVKLKNSGHNYDHAFGQALAVGDFNNDGKPDLAVGAPLSDNGTTITNSANTGGVYLYYSVNKKDNDHGVANVFLSSQTDLNNQFGVALLAEDFNNDGVE